MSDVLLIKDDFSSGDFSKWSGVARTRRENAYVVKEPPDYYARFTSGSSTTHPSGEHVYIYKALAFLKKTTNMMTAKGRFRITSSGGEGIHGAYVHLIQIMSIRGCIVASAGVYSSGTTPPLVWHLQVFTTAAPVNKFLDIYHASNPSLNKWYTVGLRWQGDEQKGRASLTVNRKPLLYVSGVNTAFHGPATNVRFGLPRMYCCTKPEVDLDDVEVRFLI